MKRLEIERRGNSLDGVIACEAVDDRMEEVWRIRKEETA
jgi:hypothetical protein